MQFEGIDTPVITPHRPDHEIDRDGFTRVIEHLVASGVHGIVIAGTTGEYYVQTRDERLMLMASPCRRKAKDSRQSIPPPVNAWPPCRCAMNPW
jgi:dihydrodipicolinate synthase/N-acetylneuraminate lyase